MGRSLVKPPVVPKNIADAIMKGRKMIRTRDRRAMVVPSFVGKTFHVYNGKSYVAVLITEYHLGFRLGDFAPTRKFFGHRTSKK